MLKISFLFLFVGFLSVINAQETVTMGPSYAQDVYYSMKDGEVQRVDRENWDIAFHTAIFSAAIITNGAAGVELYNYPKSDTSGWNSIDTTGLATWIPMYNSPDDWENGAFNRFSLDDFDYGWGKYNMINHNVVGDSIYIMKIGEEIFRKLWIVKKESVLNTYYFRYANIDGTNEKTIMLDCNPYASKNFVYYSIVDESVLDREPSNDSWDILFTRYMGLVQNTPYPVAGVLNNINVAANKFTEVGPDFDSWTSMPMDTAKSPVGYDWKEFSFGPPPGYVVGDSLAYFVQTIGGDVYKLVFTAFDYLNGSFEFNKQMISSLGMEDPVAKPMDISIYPNPAKDFININIQDHNVERIDFKIFDLSGRAIQNGQLDFSAGGSTRLELPGLKPGIYFMRFDYGNVSLTSKILLAE
jgi:hypothetical protein